MPENWATEALESAVANGLLRGADGKIMPDSPLTRAQMAAIIVRAFAAIDKSDISTYVDVRSSDWFADDIAKADKMGVMQGYGDGIMNPNGNITREQAFTVLARALKLAPASDIDVSFQDVDEISEWAKGPVYALVNAGYVQGSNGRLNPKSSIRRDEFAQLMYNLIKQYITDGGEYTEVAEGNIMVNAPGVTLKGVTIDGDLIIGDGVGDGEVILDDVIVTGRLVVRGGGENSIIIRGSSSISNVIVARVDGVVRVFVDDGSEVGVIYVDDGSDDVIVEGSIGRLEVGADSVTVTATDADINSASISGVNSAIIVDADSNIESIEISGADASVDVAGRVNSVTTTAANTSITGKGTVRNVAVQAGADGAAIETPKTKIQVDEGVTGVTGGGGAEIEAGKTVENNADGTGVVEPGAYVPWVPTVTYAEVSNATAEVLNVEFDASFINYEDFTITGSGATVTISGDLVIEVTSEDTVTGFGPISQYIKDGQLSTRYALIAWMMDNEEHVWIIGNATKSFTVEFDGVTYTIDIGGLNWDKVTKVTKEQLKAENFTDDSVKKVNYDNLTVEQLGSKVTIKSNNLVKVTQADSPIAGFGSFTIPTEGIKSDKFALIAWIIGDEPHIWLVGNATEKFSVEYNGIEYTIDISGLDWADPVTKATKQDLLSAEFTEESVNSVNYGNLDVTQEGANITITGGDLVRVENGDEVEGFGKISIPDGVQSKAFGLIAWKIGTEPHIWLVGNATESFEVTWNGFTYTIDITGLVWEGV